MKLTIRVLDRLLLLGRFGYDFDLLALEDTNIKLVCVEHFEREAEVLALVRVRYEQRFGRSKVLKP